MRWERHTYPDEVRHACMCRHAVSVGRHVSDLNPISSSSGKGGKGFQVETYVCSLTNQLVGEGRACSGPQKGHLAGWPGHGWDRYPGRDSRSRAVSADWYVLIR